MADPLEQLSDADLHALSKNDLESMSDEGLKIVAASGGSASKPAPPSAMASGARQALSGFSGNLDDEASGAISAAGRVAGVENLGTWKPFNPNSHLQYADPTLDPEKLMGAYRQNRDAARSEQHADAAAHPVISSVANAAGMMANPYLRAMNPAGMGAVQGFGNSEADLTKGDVIGAAKDTAIGTGMGYVGGKVADAASDVLAPKIQQFANRKAVQALSIGKGDAARMGIDAAEDVGQSALENGVISSNPLNNSTESMLSRAEKFKAGGGQQMGKVYSAIDDAGASTFNPLDVATDVEQQLAPTYKTPINKGEWGQLENTMESILQRGDGTIGLNEAQGLKEEIGQVAYPKGRAPIDPTPKQLMAQDAYHIVNKAIDDAADKGAATIGTDGLKEALQKGKDQYGAGSQMVRSLRGKEAGELTSQNNGLGRYLSTDVVKNVYKDTVGSPKFMASTANSLSTVLRNSPQVFGKWAPALTQAAQRGETSLNATDYILQQRDPAYRAKRMDLNNKTNDDSE